jgi:hypothetical protein
VAAARPPSGSLSGPPCRLRAEQSRAGAEGTAGLPLPHSKGKLNRMRALIALLPIAGAHTNKRKEFSSLLKIKRASSPRG